MSEPNLYQFLKDDAAVAAIVAARIFPNMIPQHVYSEATKQPCAVFQRVGGTRQPMHCATDRTVESSFQVDSYALKYEQSVDLASAIRRRMVDYCGPMGSVSVKGVFLETDFDAGPEPEPGLYRRSQTFTVWYWED